MLIFILNCHCGLTGNLVVLIGSIDTLSKPVHNLIGDTFKGYVLIALDAVLSMACRLYF